MLTCTAPGFAGQRWLVAAEIGYFPNVVWLGCPGAGVELVASSGANCQMQGPSTVSCSGFKVRRPDVLASQLWLRAAVAVCKAHGCQLHWLCS